MSTLEIIEKNVTELEDMEKESRLTRSHWDLASETFILLVKEKNRHLDLLKIGTRDKSYEKAVALWAKFIKTDIGYITARGY